MPNSSRLTSAGGDVGAQRTLVDGLLDQRGEPRVDLTSATQRRELDLAVAPHPQQQGDGRLVVDQHLDAAVHRLPQPFVCRAAGRTAARLLDDLGQPVEGFVEGQGQQVGLARDVVVDRGLAEAELTGQVAHAGAVVALLVEQLDRAAQHRLLVIARTSPARGAPSAGSLTSARLSRPPAQPSTRSRNALPNLPSGSRARPKRPGSRPSAGRAAARSSAVGHEALAPVRPRAERQEGGLDRGQHGIHGGLVEQPGEVEAHGGPSVRAAEPQLVGSDGADLDVLQNRRSRGSESRAGPQGVSARDAVDEVLALQLLAAARGELASGSAAGVEPRPGGAALVGDRVGRGAVEHVQRPGRRGDAEQVDGGASAAGSCTRPGACRGRRVG